MKYYYTEFQRAIISKGYKVKNAVKFPLQNGKRTFDLLNLSHIL